MNCKRYRGCRKDSRPCCKCEEEDSGYDVKEYKRPRSTRNCKDENKMMCESLGREYCFSGYYKQMCSRTCNVCTRTKKRSLADELSSKIIEKRWPGGRLYIGQVLPEVPDVYVGQSLG